MRKLFLLMTVLTLVAAAGAQAVDAALVVYRVTDAPGPLEPSDVDNCPAGGGVATMRSPAGRPIGTSRLCLQNVEFICEPFCVQRETGTLTNTLARGQIFVDVSFTYVFNESFTRAIHFATGTVTGGTGAFVGSSGSLWGGGLIRFDPDFTPYPNLVYAIRVR
jgi:hypothetical protein